MYMRDTKVAEQLGVSRATIWRWVKLGDFPKPVKLTSGSTRWNTEDIVQWLESKK